MTKRILAGLSRRTHQRTVAAAVGTAALLVSCIGLVASAEIGQSAATSIVTDGPTLRTDKTGYLGGEAITINGTGFVPGGVVTLAVTHADGTDEPGMGHEGFPVQAGADGTFVATWTLSADDTAGVELLAAAEGGPSTPFRRVAVVSTDKFDYDPGQTATIRGAGFLPGELVTVMIEHSNGTHARLHPPMLESADADGLITVRWFVEPETSKDSLFRLTASGSDSGLVATTTFTDAFVNVVDDGGPDDLSGGSQRDLTSMGVDYAPGLGADLGVMWAWDDTAQGGQNTADACALFDTDADGFANYALCVAVSGTPLSQVLSPKQPGLFVCNDTARNACPSAVAKTTTSVASAAVVENVDPFRSNSLHTASKCDGSNCRTADTVANLTVRFSDFAVAAGFNVKLMNVCSYNSSNATNPQDCIVVPDNGFLTIKKVAQPNESTPFRFDLVSGTSENGSTTWTRSGSGDVSLVSFAPGTYGLREAIPASWRLDTASCVIQTNPQTATGTADATLPAAGGGSAGITGVQIRSGLETICTFTNTRETQGISLTKTPNPTTYDAVGQEITYTYTIKNTGNTALAGPFDVSDDKIGSPPGAKFACSSGPLAPDATSSCTKAYTITAADIKAGSVTNTATATFNTLSAVDTATVTSTCQAPAEVTISPAGPVARSVGDELTLTASVQNGTPKLHYVWKKNDATIAGAPDSATYTIDPLALGDSGTYSVVVSNECGEGTASTNTAVLTVSRAATTLTVGAATGTYGGSTSSPLTATLTANGTGLSGKTVSFTLNGNAVGTAVTNSAGVATLAAVTSLAGINAGVHAESVKASFAEDATYAAATASNALTVDKATLTIAAVDKSHVYDGAPFTAFTSSISGFVNGETESSARGSGALAGAAVYTGEATTAVNVRATPYVITPAVGTLTATNYDFTFSNGELRITPRPVTVSADAKSKMYGDSDPALTYKVTSGSLVTDDSFTGELEREPGEAVGDYAVTQGTLALSTNYTLTFVGTKLTIEPRKITVTADAKSKMYGEPDPALTYTVTAGSLASGDSFTGALTRDPGVAVGTYPITQGTLALSTNYTLTFVGANLTINPRAITVAADAKSKMYGQADPALTYTVTAGSLASGDSFAGALVRAAGENVGTYPITQGTLALSTNYSLSVVGANLIVTPAPLSITAAATSVLYPGAPVYSATYSGFVGTDTASVLTGSLSYAALSVPGATIATPPLGPGNYMAVAGGQTSPNYDITYVPGLFTVGNDAPVIASVTGPPPVPVASTGTASASLKVVFTDAGVLGDTFTISSLWTPDGGTQVSGVTSYNGLTGAGTITATGLMPGVYAVVVTVTDRFGATSHEFLYQFVVIYDPNGGFVTGGGWIESPAGACQGGVVAGVCDDDLATGRANFGFMSKYLKGQVKPTGNTEFQFHAGSLNFKSTEYDWLVISGTTQAQYKGTGTINGSGTYGFMLTSVDGDNFGAKKPDAFRLKIWEKASGETVYDNQLGKAETSLTDATVLSGGSIVIHSTAKK